MVVENRGMAISKAMETVGYKKKTAKNPKNLTESKGWEELLEEHLPDSLLVKKEIEGLDANKVISANITYGEADEKTNDFIEVPDMQTRHKYLETGLKMKKKLSETNINVLAQKLVIFDL